ncbi:hypothetical protein [Pimelobacter sp. 30-1]|uniref:hypothetical protein n=1 Tax=Pimelobacter sp. 30-1 TaxID=2004991 RepID=UPI001C051A05|nr:hypothetical protein [Pimelobacter sp. 30-1]MBU2697570.1 hypothetical protein [Pimelobacter sp. 30-1]
MSLAVVALVLVVVLAIAVALLLGALIEMYRQLEQLRAYLSIEDRAEEIDSTHLAGRRPSAFGLAEHLDTVPAGGVLVLSEKCATCHQLAEWIGPRRARRELQILVVPQSQDNGASFIEEYGLTQHLLVEPLRAGAVSNALGLHTTPAVLFIAEGRFASMETVPSVRRLDEAIGRLATPNVAR